VVIPKENMQLVLLSLMIRENLKPIPSDNRRFTMLGTLVGGRIDSRSALAAAKSGLTAIRYSDQRRQFGPEGGPKFQLNYRIHQRRLAVIGKNVCNPFLHYNVTNRLSKVNLKCQKLKPCCRYEGLFNLAHNNLQNVA
jgi:acyl-CoA oxidase